MKKSCKFINDRIRWEKLTFANNFLFCKIMESEPEICKHLLEMLLDIKIEKLEAPEAERTVQEDIGAKSVRFDVYTKDENRIFDIEIQTTMRADLSKRARYYQSILDVDNLSHGELYTKLKDSYIIFLCLGDAFKEGLPVYSFENMCRENTALRLDDGTFKIFFNAEMYDRMNSQNMKSFFKYLAGKNADDDFTRQIEEKVSWAKKNIRWRKQYMTWQQTIDEAKMFAYEEAYNEAYDEAYNEAYDEAYDKAYDEAYDKAYDEAYNEAKEKAHEKTLESARLMLRDGVPIEQVSKWTSLPLEEVQKVSRTIK